MLAEIHPRLPTLFERTVSWVGRRRSAAGFALGAAIVVVAAIAGFGRIETEASLFDADLQPAQIVDVENALTLWGEPFHVNPQGTQISVASARRRDLLLRLTIAGLPRRYIPTSTDILGDQANALTPQSIIDDRRRSGIEGDIVAGLRRIAGVADATVVLAPALADPLDRSDRDAQPSAAVQIVMEAGSTLPADAVAGIRRFVASAYPGLTPERVAVVDSTGAMIGSGSSPDPALAKERRVQTAVQSALDAVLGARSAVVRVSIATAGADEETQSTRVVPHGALKAETARERGSEAGKSFDKERTVRSYAYDTLTERRVTSAEAPARISVAVFLDAHRIARSAEGDIAALVRAAAGADLHNGDEVVVQSVPFAIAAPSPAPDPSKPAPSQSGGLVQAAVACAIALFGFASLPRTVRHIALPFAAAPMESESSTAAEREAEKAADAAFLRLVSETPQAAAYVLESTPVEMRERVLRRCDPCRRNEIATFLDDPT